MTIDLKNFLQTVIDAAEDKKAKDLLALDISELSTIADYFVICSATNPVQAKAIADNIEDKMAEVKAPELKHKEGYNNANWILLDYGDIVVHIFQEEDRRFYNIEQLWADATAL